MERLKIWLKISLTVIATVLASLTILMLLDVIIGFIPALVTTMGVLAVFAGLSLLIKRRNK